MKYAIKFRLDIKKNVYVSKRAVSTEPYYQISAIITINKNQTIHYYTGYSAQKSAWFGCAAEATNGDGNRTYGIHKNNYAKHKSCLVLYSVVNKKLDLLASRLAILSNERETITRDELIEILDKEIGKKRKVVETEISQSTINSDDANQLWALGELFYMDKSVSLGRQKTRMNAIHHFKNFEIYRKRGITFAQSNMRLMTEFQIYLMQDEGELNDNKKSKAHHTRKKGRNTIAKILTTIKYFYKWCRVQYEVDDMGNVADYKVPAERYGDPVTLTLEEKRRLLEVDLGDECLEYTRDMFYFQCSIGCRVSDFFKLKYENLIYDNDRWCIRYRPNKTKESSGLDCRIPLSPQALAILEKHHKVDAVPKMSLFDFPKHSQTYNDNLKRVFEKAGIDRIVVTYNAYDEAEYKPLYELAKSKFARSSFIDTLVGQGVGDNIIATMSGHTAGSKAFHRYHNSLKHKQQNDAVALLD